MRGTRWLILLAIVAILGGVAITYRLQQGVLQRQAPEKPKPLPLELNASREEFVFRQSDGTRTTAEVRAKNYTQVKDSSRVDLEGVEVRMFKKDGATYDLVKSAHASLFTADKRLYSDGEVEITLAVPLEGEPKRTLVSIRSSGVTYDVANGKAATDRAATFVFQNGDGKAVGASYDPTQRELLMNSAVELHLKSKGPHAEPMKLETGSLVYKEAEATIWLIPWARLTRGQSTLDSGPATVKLEDGAIRTINAVQARGTDKYPKRELEYAADELNVHYSDDGLVDKVGARKNARLVSRSDMSETVVTGDVAAARFRRRWSAAEWW
jgi:LPS export ABC transporter protein LptC